ncbi:MAG: hypothetical protein QF692_05160 [Alphaproteobacteria bacterium]|jgi:F-type H+-transporting ATPase subunit b|nr:hypothetical protein [Alphaproteobacteria bacterium]MDP7222635.1 hypothetical protein [Alphaproteobacteria bacterium]
MLEFLEHTGSWVLISFLIFASIGFKLGRSKVTTALDSRIDGIKKELETAESLRVEAQELLAQYERKQRDAAKEAKEIVATAKEHAEEIKKSAEQDIQKTLQRREQQLEVRLGRMEDEALQEIRDYAARLAVEATEQIIIEKVGKKDHEKLVKDSLANISSRIN